MSSHSDVAAHVLGVLDESAEHAFNDRLVGCAHGQREIVEFRTIPRVLTQAEKFGLLARRIPAPPISGKRWFEVRGVPVRGLLLVVVAAVPAVALPLGAVPVGLGTRPADNHLSSVSRSWG